MLGSIVALLGVALTATSFTWREHVTRAARERQRAGEPFDLRDYPGATALLNNAKVPKLPMRPTVLEAKEDLPETTTDGCISDFDNVERDQLHLRRQGGDPHHRAGRRIARRALDHRARSAGPAAPLQGGDLHEDGLPADHRASPAGDGRQPPVPEMPRVESSG